MCSNQVVFTCYKTTKVNTHGFKEHDDDLLVKLVLLESQPPLLHLFMCV